MVWCRRLLWIPANAARSEGGFWKPLKRQPQTNFQVSLVVLSQTFSPLFVSFQLKLSIFPAGNRKDWVIKADFFLKHFLDFGWFQESARYGHIILRLSSIENSQLKNQILFNLESCFQLKYWTIPNSGGLLHRTLPILPSYCSLLQRSNTWRYKKENITFEYGASRHTIIP